MICLLNWTNVGEIISTVNLVSSFSYHANYKMDGAMKYNKKYCIICASVQEDNPRSLASGLLPVQPQKHT